MARERTMKRRQDKQLTVSSHTDSGSGPRRVMPASTARAPKKLGGEKADREKTNRAKESSVPKSREMLLRDLTVAEAKINDLEKRLALVTDRIAWVADRLHSILADKK
jgi:hypothetical protein